GKAKASPQLPGGTPLTPQQAANEALSAAGKTTVVSVQSTLTVAGQAAYQLVLAPKDARSTIGSVRIAIDGKTGVPLRVQVFGKDTQAAISALLGAAKPVSGAWGSGTLLHTSLVNVLFVGNEMYLGAVDPSVLYAAVGHATPANGS